MVNTLLTSPMEISKKNDLLDNYPRPENCSLNSPRTVFLIKKLFQICSSIRRQTITGRRDQSNTIQQTVKGRRRGGRGNFRSGRGRFLGRRGSDRGGRKYYSNQRSQRNYSLKEKQGRKGKDT
jgi:hypothetical protein